MLDYTCRCPGGGAYMLNRLYVTVVTLACHDRSVALIEALNFNSKVQCNGLKLPGPLQMDEYI
jgi:hypothetical protein